MAEPDVSVIMNLNAPDYYASPQFLEIFDVLGYKQYMGFITAFGELRDYSYSYSFNIPDYISYLYPDLTTINQYVSGNTGTADVTTRSSLQYYCYNNTTSIPWNGQNRAPVFTNIVSIVGPDQYGEYDLYIFGAFARWRSATTNKNFTKEFYILLRNGWQIIEKVWPDSRWASPPYIPNYISWATLDGVCNITNDSIHVKAGIQYGSNLCGTAVNNEFLVWCKIKKLETPIQNVGYYGKTLRLKTTFVNLGTTHTFKVFSGIGSGTIDSFAYNKYGIATATAVPYNQETQVTIDIPLTTELTLGDFDIASIIADATGDTVGTITYTYDIMVKGKKLRLDQNVSISSITSEII